MSAVGSALALLCLAALASIIIGYLLGKDEDDHR